MKKALLAIFFISLVTLASKAQNPQWINCILITKTGDAIKAQLKNKKDFSALGCLLPGQEIIIRRTNGKEVLINISAITEILIPNRPANNNHYLILNCNHTCPGQFHIYRVITDGTCKLLYTEMPGKAGTMTINISHHGETISTLNQRVANEFYVYYNKALTLAHVDDEMNLNATSKSDCAEIFKACPEIVKKLTDKKTKALKINEVVEGFNECGNGNR